MQNHSPGRAIGHVEFSCSDMKSYKQEKFYGVHKYEEITYANFEQVLVLPTIFIGFCYYVKL